MVGAVPRAPCMYAVAPEECFEVRGDRTERVAQPERFLCAWAEFHPDAPAKLVDTPPWLSRNAIAGAWMRAGDCAHCVAYQAGEPVE